MQKEELTQSKSYAQTLYRVLDDHIKPSTIKKKNRTKSWKYGYDEEFDVVVISNTGQIGEVYEIQNLKIALPKEFDTYKFKDNKWKQIEYPKELQRIKTIFDWKEYPEEFKEKWYDYIEEEFKRRENGFWFINKDKPTYITGSHYMYLQWSKIDVGQPDFREANRLFYIFWEACKADSRCFGMCYLKNRRSGFSFMSSGETVNLATISVDSRYGILSKSGPDAKKMFTDKVVPISVNYPFFFKPIQDGMDRPKTELAYRVPASKFTRRKLDVNEKQEDIKGLDTTIDWKNTGDNSYDGEKLKLLVHDECYHPSTEIMDENMDFKPINEYNIGDKVTVEGGVIKTVVKKTEGYADSYLIKQPYGKDFIVTENHRLVLNEYKKGEVVLTAKEFFESSKFRKKHLTRVVSTGIEREDVFNGIPPYLLGLWLGDGRYSAMSIIVNQDEEPEILHYLGRLAEIMNVDFDIINRDECKAHVVEFRFKGINDELKKIGVYKNKHVPEQYMKSSIDTRLQVLAGLIDTDGYSDKKKGCIEIGMANETLVSQAREIALSCGLSCSEVKHSKSNFDTDRYKVSISGDLARIPILTEKKSFGGYKPKTRGRRNKVSIKKIGVQPYVGIQVDAVCDNERKLVLSDYTISMNSGKWERPNNILNNWRVTKTCLRLGSRIIGKCMMGSTSNALDKGGDNFKKLYYASDVTNRNSNGQTSSGLYSLFIPMEWNYEGYIDSYGLPVFDTPEKPVQDPYGGFIKQGVIEYWDNEVEGLKGDQDGLNEFYRQFPRTEQHAFRDEAKQSIFNLTKIYQQIDHNEGMRSSSLITRGNFQWENGIQDTRVMFMPNPKGRFHITWIPPVSLQNRIVVKNGTKYPGNEHLGAFGCDPYDISGTVDKRGSKGSAHGLTKFSMEDAPSNHFFLEYIARPQTAEIFFEDILMACVFYGMPILAENNKPRLLYHFKNRGYRGFSMNRPDKTYTKLSATEREIGGIPNSSEDIKQAHAAAIETYIEELVGVLGDDEMGDVYFQRTLEDWARFNINNRTAHDASISSGLAIMACNRNRYAPVNKVVRKNINLGLARYDNTGNASKIINR